jgi:integrase
VPTGRIIEEIKGKKYKIIIEAGKDPATGKRKRIVRRIEGRKPDAQALMSQIVMELKQGTYVEPKRITVADWLYAWLHDYKKMELRPTTWEGYRIQANTHIIPAIGQIGIQELRPEHLQKLYNEKLESGLSSRSVRYIHTTIYGALKQAVRNQLIPRNVAEAITLPKHEKSQARALTIKEQSDLLIALQADHRLGAAFIVLMATGLRRGELLGLRWRNIDFDNKHLTVEENLVWINGATLYQPPKTARSRERVPLIRPVIEALKAHREKMLAEGNYGKDKPVFCTKVGTPYIPRNFNRKFEELREKAGISKDVTVHSLRHTFATRLLERGVAMKEVQELLRHEVMATTADIYSHVSEELKREAISKLNHVLKDGTNRAPKTV